MRCSASLLRLVLLAAATTVSWLATNAAAAEERLDLSAPTKPSLLQVRALIEIQGELKTNIDGKEVRRLPLKVAAEQQYLERSLKGSDAAVRYYKTSTADIVLGKAELRESLREQVRYLVLSQDGDRPTLFSPHGLLSREELELVETPASLIPLTDLLPDKSVVIGDTWTITDTTLARLLCLDAVHQQDVVCKLAGVEDGVATVSIGGKAAGAVEGVSSDVELIAKYNFDVRQKAITWLTLAARENRAVGHAQPGFETVTKLRLVAAPVSSAVELSDESLAGLSPVAKPGDTFLELRSQKGGYELVHDRRWRVMVDRHDVAVMRLIDRGDLIAQCNVSKLPKLPAGEQLTLEGFQEDVRKTLGKNFGQIIEASQQVTEGGIRVLRVVASGNASELPIQWTYYHLSDDEGSRASLVLTIEADLVERFAAVDRELVSGFRFIQTSRAGETPSQSIPAEKAALKPKQSATTTR